MDEVGDLFVQTRSGAIVVVVLMGTHRQGCKQASRND